jgi:hypothetical protein
MFGLLESLAKAAVAVVSTPVAMVADLAEELDIIDDSGKSHTQKALNNVLENLEDAAEPRKW